jgi:predicted ATP-grasp superfamily ATP-dependent carboligase
MTFQTHLEPICIPCAVLSFTGWPDAAEMIQHSVAELKRMVPCQLAASWDLDGFWHLDAIRPQVHIRHGQIQLLEWPSYKFFAAHLSQDTTILLGSGPEPSCNWRRYAQTLVDQLRNWGCEQIVLLGSVFDQVFHDETLISAVVQEPQMFNRVRDLGCQMIEYQGPGAIHTAIMEAAMPLAIPCVSLWAHLPFYLKGPSELLMDHYLQTLGRLLDTQLDTHHLLIAWKQKLEQIETLIDKDRELKQLLEQLKSHDTHRKGSPQNASKILRMAEFAKKRNNVEPEP